MRLLATLLALSLLSAATPLFADDFASSWDKTNDRVWIGPGYWGNPLQDWRVSGGKLECAVSGGNRSVFLLTREASAGKGTLSMSVRLSRLPHSPQEAAQAGWGGFRIGIQGTLPDYRNAAIHGKGLDVGITTRGHLFVGKQEAKKIALPMDGEIELKLTAKPGPKNYQVTLAGAAVGTDKKTSLSTEIPANQIGGHFALVSHYDAAASNPKAKANPRRQGTGTNRGGNVRFAFDDWKIGGNKVKANPGRAFGPILWTQYTLSGGVMKMIAMMPPVGAKDSQTVRLETRGAGGWKPVAEETIDPLSRTALFRIENWDATKDTPYRVAYKTASGDAYWTGTIRKDPVDKESVVVAGFTGNTDYLFPNARIARNVAIQDPDLLFFSGDQIYESVAGYGIQKTANASIDTCALDYLRKFWLCGWAFRDVMRDRPTILMPDDHDVYQGNIWGHNGRLSTMAGNADGGFHMDPVWVNMVNRTQTGHHPDPFDPAPLDRGISVYYGPMTYGGISFAVIEDRKFKTGPATVLPDKKGRPDHVRPEDVDEKTWDPREIDVPEAILLGERQLRFLDEWAADWTGADFKCVLSQTIFVNLANYHGGNQEYLVADLDSNGWPQTGRGKALDAMRRGFAFHYAGDQHLPSIVHYGVDTWNDAGWAFCVPSIAAGYPRSWRPDDEGRPALNRPEPGLPNTGEYRDGLHNYVTVYAIGNPAAENRTETPETLGHDKSSGHGIVRFNRKDRTITMECYRLLFDAKNAKPKDQFPGWPRTIKLEDNYGRAAAAHLPTLKIAGMKNPVVQVIHESSREIVYTLRVGSSAFRPKVFDKGAAYTVIIGEPAAGKTKTLTGIRPDEKATLDVSL